MTTDIRAKIIKWATLALTVAAFAGSYRHGVAWAMAHTAGSHTQFWPLFWIRLTAALPEVMVALSVLRTQDNPRDTKAWVVGSSAVGWQLWANGSEAGHGVSGLVIALWPAWAALSALWLTSHGPVAMARVTEPSSRATGPRKRATVTRVNDSFTPSHGQVPVVIAADLGPAGDPPEGTAMARGMAWAMAQPELPSRATIQAKIGCSPKTASRIRGAVREAREGESES